MLKLIKSYMSSEKGYSTKGAIIGVVIVFVFISFIVLPGLRSLISGILDLLLSWWAIVVRNFFQSR
jgi:hypothetical protein